LTGIAGGVAIVLPYLLPFLIGLAILEDTGYLPRMAYILDNFMHRIGLHGKSVLPLILGYGCSVPAIMSARILPSSRDRRITAVLASFIPCSARTVVIFGLVAAYMGPWWALFIYVLNLVLVVLLGNVLARKMKGAPPGLILEIPELQVPSFRTLAAKTWLTLKEFITIAWPLLVVSSVILGLLEWAHAAGAVTSGDDQSIRSGRRERPRDRAGVRLSAPRVGPFLIEPLHPHPGGPADPHRHGEEICHRHHGHQGHQAAETQR